ncbi:type II toxin-antitoxin system VapC family toxin [Avibacterium paragallinarum]|uniref:type II toxin-antitoxin system VapC family toxin n=1 Tax=Avibacterium paragallinarum TaxID=728 RepID=UPI0010289103|nr:type II toxin-antitoxin system VapC family toxin [Avibacterium paragallinarum]RZN56038.1 type II toxin-antitoxin system VapC family toxin [Avibacterium paragallinarum]TID27201.1 ribonuclease VapC [Avibacterium paragallinarum]
MIYMLDTNILIYLMKNKPLKVTERVAQLSTQDKLVMSFITYAELLKGANGSTHSLKARENIARITQRISVLLPPKEICEFYGIWADRLKRQGTPIGGNDLWIACHALACDAVLVTHNVKEFQRISSLKWQDWTV